MCVCVCVCAEKVRQRAPTGCTYTQHSNSVTISICLPTEIQSRLCPSHASSEGQVRTGQLANESNTNLVLHLEMCGKIKHC